MVASRKAQLLQVQYLCQAHKLVVAPLKFASRYRQYKLRPPLDQTSMPSNKGSEKPSSRPKRRVIEDVTEEYKGKMQGHKDYNILDAYAKANGCTMRLYKDKLATTKKFVLLFKTDRGNEPFGSKSLGTTVEEAMEKAIGSIKHQRQRGPDEAEARRISEQPKPESGEASMRRPPESTLRAPASRSSLLSDTSMSPNEGSEHTRERPKRRVIEDVTEKYRAKMQGHKDYNILDAYAKANGLMRLYKVKLATTEKKFVLLFKTDRDNEPFGSEKGLSPTVEEAMEKAIGSIKHQRQRGSDEAEAHRKSKQREHAPVRKARPSKKMDIEERKRRAAEPSSSTGMSKKRVGEAAKPKLKVVKEPKDIEEMRSHALHGDLQAIAEMKKYSLLLLQDDEGEFVIKFQSNGTDVPEGWKGSGTTVTYAVVELYRSVPLEEMKKAPKSTQKVSARAERSLEAGEASGVEKGNAAESEETVNEDNLNTTYEYQFAKICAEGQGYTLHHSWKDEGEFEFTITKDDDQLTFSGSNVGEALEEFYGWTLERAILENLQ